MKNELDELLKYALTPIDEPENRLNQNIINQAKEREKMKKQIWKRLPAMALLAVIVLGCTSATAFALHRLSIHDIIEKNKDVKLLDAFSSSSAIYINETQSYGGYNVTLLGIVSGKNLSDFTPSSCGTLLEDRTYSVVAIEHTDGTPMAEPTDPAYESFFISPLIRDFNPIFYNAYAFNGGSAHFVEDGVRYCIEECDNVEVFADHGLYLCICDDVFYKREAYQYDEATGVISRNEDYNGLNALFDLPIDASKADPKAAKKIMKEAGYGDREGEDLYLDEENEPDPYEKSEPNTDQKGKPNPDAYNYADKDEWRRKITPENIDLYADLLEDSVQNLTPDEQGFIHYQYKGSGITNVSGLFEQDEKFIIHGIAVGSSDNVKTDEAYIDTFKANDDGTITYAVYRVKQSVLENSSQSKTPPQATGE